MREQSISNNLSRFLRKIYCIDTTDEFKEKASLFLFENDKYNKMSIDEIGEKESEKLVDEFKKIIRSIDSTL